MLTVLRFLVVVPLGFLVACLAASFALVWPFLGPLPPLADHPLFWLEAATAFTLQLTLVAGASFVPWVAFVLASEALALRSLLFHALAGLGGALLATGVAYGAAPPQASVRTALLVAGLAFALVYWLVAGRDAGRWRRRRLPPSPPSPPPEEPAR